MVENVKSAGAQPAGGNPAGAQPAGGGGRSWLGTLLSYSGRCKGRMALSLLASVLSVAAGFAPFYAVYRIMADATEGRLSLEGAAPWLAVAAVAYVASKALFGVSTLLSHVCAYTILETLRRDFVDKLMKASLGTVQGKSVGQVKNVFVDRIEGVEVPLAHLIPELTGSLLLAAGLAVWLVLIDWRMAAACLAWRHPEHYGRVLAQSGSFWWGPNAFADDPARRDGGWLTRQFAQGPRTNLVFYLQAGLLETRRNGDSTDGILESSRALAEQLRQRGYTVKLHEYAGGHDYAVWREGIADGLIYLLGK